MRVRGALALVFLLAAPSARAQSDDDESVHRPRVRVGVSFVSGFLEVPYASLETSPTVVGASVRVGVQLNDHVALFDQASLTAFWPQLRDVAYFEWTAVDWFSVGVGPAIEWAADFGGSADSDWSLGGAVRLALHAPFSRGVRGRRRAVTFSVEVTPSYAFAGTNTYSSSGFQLGFLGGVGIELY